MTLFSAIRRVTNGTPWQNALAELVAYAAVTAVILGVLWFCDWLLKRAGYPDPENPVAPAPITGWVCRRCKRGRAYKGEAEGPACKACGRAMVGTRKPLVRSDALQK